MKADDIIAHIDAAAWAHGDQASVDHMHEDDSRFIRCQRVAALRLASLHIVADAIRLPAKEREELRRIISHRLIGGGDK